MECRIAISGVSGKFPESDNVSEFCENLYDKVDLITEDNRRWNPELYLIPKRMGKLKDISKFDNKFFGVSSEEADKLDPQIRILLELTYESIVDSGYDPDELRGKNIGVFIGCTCSENEEFFSKDSKKIDSHSLIGCKRSMFASRISSYFDFKGPSVVLDTACSSGAVALHEAVQAIRRNQCEAAVVGSANLCLKPENSIQYHKLNMLSPDGSCKSFDASRNGYCRSEAIVTLFLQRRGDARREYATVVHTKTNTDGFKEAGITFPSYEAQKQLLLDVYNECGLSPLEVSYVEAHGTGTPAGDPVEMAAFAEVFCKDRDGPLLVGSVKSNMGHSEGSAGLCGIVKLLFAIQNRLIPPNLHYKTPNPEIPSLLDGRVRIVSQPTFWKGRYAAASSYGFGGVNVHAILEANLDQSDPQKSPSIPQLVLYGGRTGDGIECVFDYVEEYQPQRDFFALLHRTAYAPVRLKPFRGFKVDGYGQSPEFSDIKMVEFEKRPVWFVFSGMETQWPGVVKQLMNLDAFSDSILRSSEVLKPYGIDLMDLVRNGENCSGDSKRNISTMPAIAALQIALVDVLNALGIKPDGLIGDNAGELGCAYADGCLTAEQAVLTAYWMGKTLDESNTESALDDSMSELDISGEDLQNTLLDDTLPEMEYVTVAGSVYRVVESVEFQSSDEKSFAEEEATCGMAFPNRFLLPDAASKMQAALENVIPDPRQRSAKWLSTSYQEMEWTSPKARLASAEYFVHSLTSSVPLQETLGHVPEDAVLIEIVPHHQLHDVLKGELGPPAECIGLIEEGEGGIGHLLSSVGRLYMAGLDPDIEKLYPPVKFPVSRTTAMISPLIQWDHSESWFVSKWESLINFSRIPHEVDIGSDDSPDKYLEDHCIDGRVLYPGAGYLVLAWNALAVKECTGIESLPVCFEDVAFHRVTVLSKEGPTKLIVRLATSSTKFEITDGTSVVCSGRISLWEREEPSAENPMITIKEEREDMELNSNDFYKELRLRGYEYGPAFQGVIGSDLEGKCGLVRRNKNWVVFLDNVLQFTLLSSSKRSLRLPIRIQSVNIDPVLHKILLSKKLKKSPGVPVKFEKNTNRWIAGGVEIINLITTFAPRNQCGQVPVLEEYRFVPYIDSKVISDFDEEMVKGYINVCTHVTKTILEENGINSNDLFDTVNTELDSVNAESDNVDRFLKLESENYVLLKHLRSIKSAGAHIDLECHVKEIVSGGYNLAMEKDILYQNLISEKALKTVVDVIIENYICRRLVIAEACESTDPLCTKIGALFDFTATQSVNYLIAHTKPEILSKSTLSNENVNVVQWDSTSFNFNDVDIFAIKYLDCGVRNYWEIFKKVSSVLKYDGFVIVVQRTRLLPMEKLFSQIGKVNVPIHDESISEFNFNSLHLQIICKKSDASSTLYLLRKLHVTRWPLNAYYFVPFYEGNSIDIVEEQYDEWVEELKEQLVAAENSPEQRNHKRIWLLSEGCALSGIVGLVNCLRLEPGGSCLRSFYVGEEPKADLKQFYKDIVMNVFKEGSWGSYRHIKMPEVRGTIESKHAYLNVLKKGDLSSLEWIDSDLKYFSPSSDRTLCHVYYAPLNFRDVMWAIGKLPPHAISGYIALKDCILGLEYSGVLTTGQRVMGIVPAKGLATSVIVDQSLMWSVPGDWSLEEACTVPVAYSTAYYALVTRAHLRKGDSILIHSGSGGVGQAAIAIALSLECEVFTSVGTSEKREFLKRRFPALQEKNFCYSRDTSFEDYILNMTGGEGVDVVLNSLSEEKFYASVNCLSKSGRFLEIGKHDFSINSPLGVDIFMKNASFHAIVLDSLFENTAYSVRIKKEIVRMVNNGIADGTVRPLNTILFRHDQAEQAFRFMAGGKHIGKVVLKIREETPEILNLPPQQTFSVLPRTTCDPHHSYLIVGGLGGVGLELCQWLVDRGAQNIVISSRSGVRTGYQRLCLNRWVKGHGVKVLVSGLDVTMIEEAERLLQLTASLGPVGGIFNLAMVLRDALMENQTVENFEIVCSTKIRSTRNLDFLSQRVCPDLQWFVCFSSVSCGRGNPGQSNYAYGNSFMERICEDRHKNGLPGLAIQWGAIADVGVIQDTRGSDVVIMGKVPQRIHSCLEVLDKFLHQSHPVVSCYVPYQPTDSDLRKASRHNVLSVIANIFGMKDMTTLKPDTTLGELGMDSLMGVEVNQFLERDFALVLSIPEIRRLKIKDLKDLETSSFSNKSDNCRTRSEHIGYISIKDLVPKETLVKMNSIETGTPLYIVHPIDGSVAMLKTLVAMLNVPVYGIQCTPEAPLDSISDLADWYWKHIPSTSPIYLAGYSFGASVAFEMCLQRERAPERQPRVARLALLDGSPALVSAITRAYFINDSKEKGETQALCSFVQQYWRVNLRELKSSLLNLPSFESRIKYTSYEIAKSQTGLTAEEVLRAFNLHYKRLQIANKYSPEHKLEKDIFLIKATDRVEATRSMSVTYDLEKVSDGKILTCTVKGSHTSFIEGKGASKVSKLLKDFLSS